LEVEISHIGKVEKKGEGWKPQDLKFIIVKFEGRLKSNYKYPIKPEDEIQKIVIRVEHR